jgi:hypothetical protein
MGSQFDQLYFYLITPQGDWSPTTGEPSALPEYTLTVNLQLFDFIGILPPATLRQWKFIHERNNLHLTEKGELNN